METNTSTVEVKIETDIVDMEDSYSLVKWTNDSKTYCTDINGKITGDSNITIKEEIDDCENKICHSNVTIKEEINNLENNPHNTSLKDDLANFKRETFAISNSIDEDLPYFGIEEIEKETSTTCQVNDPLKSLKTPSHYHDYKPVFNYESEMFSNKQKTSIENKESINITPIKIEIDVAEDSEFCFKNSDEIFSNDNEQSVMKIDFNKECKKVYWNHEYDEPLNLSQLSKSSALIHDGDKPFSWNRNDNELNSASSYTQKISLFGEKPMSCSQTGLSLCQTDTKSKGKLVSHPHFFSCIICDKTFSTAGHFKQHRLIHKEHEMFSHIYHMDIVFPFYESTCVV